MEGVEILATEQIATDTTSNWTVSFIVAGIILFVSIVIGLIRAGLNADGADAAAPILIGCVLSVVGFTMTGIVTTKPIAYETRYTVTISEDVSFVEFNEKYEILEQNGLLYTVREKE